MGSMNGHFGAANEANDVSTFGRVKDLKASNSKKRREFKLSHGLLLTFLTLVMYFSPFRFATNHC